MIVDPSDKLVRGSDIAIIGSAIKGALDAKATVASFDVDETTEDGGVNTLTIHLTDGSTIEIGVRNGNKGNPGSSQAYPFELENSFSGGTSKALTAEKGKQLYERHIALSQEDYDNLETKDPDVFYYIYED